MIHIKSRIDKRRRGQSMVEFAFALPLLIFILVSIVFFGRYFLIAQVLLSAAQEAAKIAARTPNLNDPAVRDTVRGFTTGGTAVNPNSVLYGALASARLLSNTISGDMPPGSSVEILPWDATATDTIPPPGTVAVKVSYPFQLFGNPFQPVQQPNVIVGLYTANGLTQGIKFKNFIISEQATAGQEIYQQDPN
jgi:Flp pilus assembly protein TadG